MDYGLAFWPEVLFKVKNILMMDLFLTNTQLFSSQDVNWWTGVVWFTCGSLWCFYQLFGLSFWRHPFSAEHTLVSKWWNATFLQIFLWRSKLICILDDWHHLLTLMLYQTHINGVFLKYIILIFILLKEQNHTRRTKNSTAFWTKCWIVVRSYDGMSKQVFKCIIY